MAPRLKVGDGSSDDEREMLLPVIFLDKKQQSKQETDVQRDDLKDKEICDAIPGKSRNVADVPQPKYKAASFEAYLPRFDRVSPMSKDLFDPLVETGEPEQKTIIFCMCDDHADMVATEVNNLYWDGCVANGLKPNADNHHAFQWRVVSPGEKAYRDQRISFFSKSSTHKQG